MNDSRFGVIGKVSAIGFRVGMLGDLSRLLAAQ